jgi:ubiquinone/menaquinone biosynthesis C-methylase UbiE
MGGMDRYGAGAALYDLLSFERTVYRAGRVAGIDRLDLTAGDRVLDLGCGTGLSFELLLRRIGPTGELVGVDASPQMLARARARADRQGWHNVRLVRADAGAEPTCSAAAHPWCPEPVDAVLASYSLSVIRDWEPAWRHALAALRPGGRAAVIDLALPQGRAGWLAPLARLACAAGGSDPGRHPWLVAERDGRDVRRAAVRGGHIQVVVARFG